MIEAIAKRRAHPAWVSVTSPRGTTATTTARPAIAGVAGAAARPVALNAQVAKRAPAFGQAFPRNIRTRAVAAIPGVEAKRRTHADYPVRVPSAGAQPLKLVMYGSRMAGPPKRSGAGHGFDPAPDRSVRPGRPPRDVYRGVRGPKPVPASGRRYNAAIVNGA